MGDVPTPDSWLDFSVLLACAAAISLAVRIVLSLMQAGEIDERPRRFWLRAWQIFNGFGHPARRDHLQLFVLGTLEGFIYPLLMAADKPLWIGAWIALKALPRIVWMQKAGYARFLIGNALVLALSFAVASYVLPSDDSDAGDNAGPRILRL